MMATKVRAACTTCLRVRIWPVEGELLKRFPSGREARALSPAHVHAPRPTAAMADRTRCPLCTVRRFLSGKRSACQSRMGISRKEPGWGAGVDLSRPCPARSGPRRGLRATKDRRLGLRSSVQGHRAHSVVGSRADPTRRCSLKITMRAVGSKHRPLGSHGLRPREVRNHAGQASTGGRWVAG